MSLFLPVPLLLLALTSQKNAARPATLNSAEIKIDDAPKVLEHTVEIVEEVKKPVVKTNNFPAQKTAMLSDMLYYMGNPAASRMSSVVKAVTALQQPDPRMQMPMTQNQRSMGMLKVMTQMMGLPSGPMGAINMLTKTGQVGNIMSMFNKKTPGTALIPANLMDNINKVLSGMDQTKKEELLSMAKQIMSGS